MRMWRVVAVFGGGAAVIATAAVVQVMSTRIGVQPDGSALVPTGQRISPVGVVRVLTNERPKDVALSPDGSSVAVLCPRRLFVYDGTLSTVRSLERGGGPLGLAWGADGKRLYFSSGAKVVEVTVGEGNLSVLRELSVAESERPQGLPADPQAAGLALLRDGQTLAVALGTRNAVAFVDLTTGAVRQRVPVGVCPYHVALHPDGGSLWVSCRGGLPKRPGRGTAMSAGTPVATDRATDAVHDGCVSVVALATMQVRHVRVGRQPAAIAFGADGRLAYVGNSDSDTVSVVDVERLRVVGTIHVRGREAEAFGHMPTDVSISDDGHVLYVTCGGVNAVAVLPLSADGRSALKQPRYYIPTGWFPLALERSGTTLWIASSKGIGSQGDKRNGAWWVHASAGTLQRLDVGSSAQLEAWTAEVARNNRWEETPQAPRATQLVPIPERDGDPSVFKHVIYIIKENHTYDLTLGDMPEGNGDPKLCLFGEQVTPNQHAIAREFVLLDNTYTSGTNSADGHQWTSASLCNAYMEQNYSSYARSYPYDGGDPLAYSPRGFLWTAAARRGLWVRVFGEFVNRPRIVDTTNPSRRGLPSWSELWHDYTSVGGRFQILAETDNAALRPYLHPHAIGFPMNVSDQWRADQFIGELRAWERKGSMPALTMILLPNNHTAGTTPGMPTPRALVADNDLALGRIVDAVSHSRFWPETLILCIEDDSQLGVDHVEGHRTLAYCVSPYTKRGAVISELYDHTSFVRTIELVLGIPPMNRFDRSARPLRACFQGDADVRPFTHRLNRVRLDELNKPASSLRGEQRRLAEACSGLDWSDVDRADAEVVARAVWMASARGRPFPTSAFHGAADRD